jgi:raffinose/stachyose/melibiose transport system permease protein
LFLLELVMVAAAAVFAFPIYVLIVLTFKPESEWSVHPLRLPQGLYTENLRQAWLQADLGSAILSSAMVLAGSLLALLLVGSIAAYFIARTAPRIGNALYFFFLAGLVLPFQLALIPLYQLMRDLKLIGTPLSLILFYSGIQLPLTIFLYAGFIRTVSTSYDEAARLDGASDLQVFRYVIFPLLRPVTGTVLILNGVFIWNDFLTPLLYLSGSPWATVPVAVYSFVDQYVSQWGLIFAGLVIGIAPILAAFALLQRQMMRGFASGLKG